MKQARIDAVEDRLISFHSFDQINVSIVGHQLRSCTNSARYLLAD